MVPIFCEGKQRSIELLRLRIFAARWVRGIAVAVDGLGSLPVLDQGRAMPGVHNVFILVRADVAKKDHLPISVIRKWNHFANRRHPAANQAVIETPIL